MTRPAGGGLVNNGSVMADGCTFDANHASAYGGALYNIGPIHLLDSGFTSNSAGATGGAMSNSAGASGSLSGCSFSGNHAGNAGGGISVYSGSLTIVNTSIDNNSSGNVGGGLAVIFGFGRRHRRHVLQQHGQRQRRGYLQSGTLTVSGTSLTSNSASDGGGMYNTAT